MNSLHYNVELDITFVRLLQTWFCTEMEEAPSALVLEGWRLQPADFSVFLTGLSQVPPSPLLSFPELLVMCQMIPH